MTQEAEALREPEVRAFLAFFGNEPDEAAVLLWVEALSPLPINLLNAAMIVWVRENRHAPMPADIVEIVKNQLSPKRTMRGMAEVVARENGLTVCDLISPDRAHRIAHPRQDLMLMCNEAGYSLPQIGRFLGGRDHTTILHGCRAAKLRQMEKKGRES